MIAGTEENRHSHRLPTSLDRYVCNSSKGIGPGLRQNRSQDVDQHRQMPAGPFAIEVVNLDGVTAPLDIVMQQVGRLPTRRRFSAVSTQLADVQLAELTQADLMQVVLAKHADR